MTNQTAADIAAEIFDIIKCHTKTLQDEISEKGVEIKRLKQQLTKFDCCKCGHNRVGHSRRVTGSKGDRYVCCECGCATFSLMIAAGEIVILPEQLAKSTEEDDA